MTSNPDPTPQPPPPTEFLVAAKGKVSRAREILEEVQLLLRELGGLLDLAEETAPRSAGRRADQRKQGLPSKEGRPKKAGRKAGRKAKPKKSGRK